MCIRNIIRIDRDTPAGQFNRLIVLLQRKIVVSFDAIPSIEYWITRTETNCPLNIFVALFKLSEDLVLKGQTYNSIDIGRVQGDCAFLLRSGFVEVLLNKEYPGLDVVSVGEVWIDGDRRDTNSSAFLRSPLRP